MMLKGSLRMTAAEDKKAAGSDERRRAKERISPGKSMILINDLCLNIHRGFYSSCRECGVVTFEGKLVIGS